MKIAENILNILADCEVSEKTVYLPQAQLDRATYTNVNKCLENIGGKWNRKAKGHIFDYEPAEALENLIFTGEIEDMKKTFQFFPTPKELAKQVCHMAELDTLPYRDHCNVLEPSCGKGDLSDVAYEELQKNGRNDALICIELNNEMKRYLDEKPYTSMVGEDFLQYSPDTVKHFDRIVMNPPFSKQQDIDHIYHAFSLLQPGGILVSIMSCSPFFRTNKKSTDFVKWLEVNNAEVADIDSGAFKESGTLVATKIIKVKKEKTP